MLASPPSLAAITLLDALKLSGLIVAIFLVGVSGLVLWTNPRRAVNRVVFTCSLHVSIWLLLLYVAVGGPGRVFWLRCACAVASFLQFHYAIARAVIASESLVSPPRRLAGTAAWIVWSGLLAALCFSNYFIPTASTSAHRMYGTGYYIYIVGELLGYGWVIFRTYASVRRAQGGERIELEVWLIGCSATCGAILVTMGMNALTHNPAYVLAQPLLVFAFYSGTAYAITTYRVFEAGQILRLILHRLLPIGLGLVVGEFGFAGLKAAFGEASSLPLSLALVAAVLTALGLGRWLEREFQLYPQDTAARRAALEVARQETRADGLERRFAAVLKGWGTAESATVCASRGGDFALGESRLVAESGAVQTLRSVGWVTPERLRREKFTVGRTELLTLLEEKRWGVMVIVQGPLVSVLVAVGAPASRRPFSYPQVMQLLELASIFEGPLERAHLAEKMQHAEQLATVGMLGASLAHEIRNPLVTLKAFVQLLPTRYHEAAFRDKFFTLMTEEVKRIDRLTEQLLDLASPRAYTAQTIDLNAVVRAGLELVGPRATEAEVQVIAELNPGPIGAFSDPAAVKQVLLNLCLNAIQVLEGQTRDRWIRIATETGPRSVDLIVSDSGPGIAQEMQGKLFQPFQSTKSSGFGLGLAICRDILAGLDGTIMVAAPEPGRGATFRVTLPCPP